MNIDELREKTYWIMDILPRQVPRNAGGQYFKVERYYLQKMCSLCQKYTQVLLKLNCFYDIEVSHDGVSWLENPQPDSIERWMGACVSEEPKESVLYIMLRNEETLMVKERDDTYMTIYNPSGEVLELLRQLSISEGLFVWKP